MCSTECVLCRHVTQDVKIVCPAGSDQFPATMLREFVAGVDRLGIPDHTVVTCFGHKSGDLHSIGTSRVLTELLLMDGESLEQQEPDKSLHDRSLSPQRTETATSALRLRQDPTGPMVQGPTKWWRLWERGYHPTLLMRDVRALLTRGDDLGLPAERYVVRVMKAKARGSVWWIDMEPAKPARPSRPVQPTE